MMQTIDRRFLLAGALAGASSVIVLAFATVLLLALGLTWQYLFSSSIPVIQDTALGAVLADAGRIPSFLWGWRWALLAMTALGALLALAERVVQPLAHPWRDNLVAAVLVGVTGALVTGALLATADQPLYSLNDQTGTLPALASRQQGALNLVLVAVLLTLAITGVTWLLWRWWYRRWRGWFGLAPTNGAAPSTRPAEEWFALRQAQAGLRRRAGLLALAGAVLALIGVLGFEAVRAEVRSGEVWPRPDSPNVAARLSLGDRDRLLMVENTYGNGAVAVQVLRAADQQVVAGPLLLEFDERLGSQRQALDVAALPAGDYLLNAQLRSGDGGRTGYALLESQAALVLLTALVAAIGMGIALGGLAVLVLSRGGGGE